MDVGQQFNLDLTLFAPSRGYDATDAFFVAPDAHESSHVLFGVPAMAYSRPIDGDSSWGVALYGSGGMDIDYRVSSNRNSGGAPGVLCSGKAGVDLEQAFLAAGYAHRFGSVSVGVAPILAIQMFRAQGIAAFEPLSSTPANFSDTGASYSVGGGLRAGAEWRASEALRIGVSATTPIWASNFTKYSGQFAGGGNFDVPATIAARLAYDVAPTMALLPDYKHIFYGDAASVANSSLLFLSGVPFGASNGPGFGWHDVDTISIGAEWRASKDLTLRADYSHNTDPIGSADAMLNILAPGRHHRPYFRRRELCAEQELVHRFRGGRCAGAKRQRNRIPGRIRRECRIEHQDPPFRVRGDSRLELQVRLDGFERADRCPILTNRADEGDLRRRRKPADRHRRSLPRLRSASGKENAPPESAAFSLRGSVAPRLFRPISRAPDARRSWRRSRTDRPPAWTAASSGSKAP